MFTIKKWHYKNINLDHLIVSSQDSTNSVKYLEKNLQRELKFIDFPTLETLCRSHVSHEALRKITCATFKGIVMQFKKNISNIFRETNESIALSNLTWLIWYDFFYSVFLDL